MTPREKAIIAAAWYMRAGVTWIIKMLVTALAILFVAAGPELLCRLLGV